jgi:hypothetical protein
MDIIDDIFEDSNDIRIMEDQGMTIRIFGSDLDIMERRLQHPSSFWMRSDIHRPFRVFVVVTGQDQTAALLQDFRFGMDRNRAPEDNTVQELNRHFGNSMSGNITRLSNWILCAPYLSGSIPSRVPGWIPVSNACNNINVRAYMSTFKAADSRILYMNRDLMSAVFGCHHVNILSHLGSLSTTCITLGQNRREKKQLPGWFTLSYLNDLHSLESANRERDAFTIVNSVHPLSSAITLRLE